MILCVTGTPQVEEIVYGDDGLLAAARAGLDRDRHLDRRAGSSARIRADFAARGATLHRRAAGAHAEGSRGRPPQHDGRRRAGRLRALKPVLAAFCENIIHVGPPGHGHVLKLVNNMLAMTHGGGDRRSRCRGRQGGAVAAEAVRRGLGGRRQLRHLPDDGRARAAGRPRRAEVRDRATRRRTCATTPISPRCCRPRSFIAEAAHQSFVQAVNLGLGDAFIASLIEAQEQLNGVQDRAALKRRSIEETVMNEDSKHSDRRRRRSCCKAGAAAAAGVVLRPLGAQPRLGAGGAAEAAGDRPDDGRVGPVRRQRRRGAARRDDGHQGVQRQGRRARPAHRGAAHGHRDHAGHRLARGRAHDHAQRGGVPDRRGALGRGQRDLAGGAEVRLHLPQHQLELAHRIGQGLPPRQVRLGRQRHQLRARDRQERDQGQRQELGAADQRLRLGPQHREGDARDRRGQRRQDRRGAAGAAEHARLLVVPAQAAAAQARRGGHRGRRRRHQGAAPAGGAAQAATRASRGSTTSRTGPTSTASGPRRSSACSAPPGTTGSTCPA